MTAHLPTLLLVTILLGAVSSISVISVADRSQRDGMVYWAIGLATHTGSSLFLIQLDAVGEFASFVLAGALRSCTWAFFTEGLYEFQRSSAPRKLIWTPVAIVPLLFMLLADHVTLRVIAIATVIAAQALLPLWLIWRKRQQTPGRGQYFLMTGLALALALLLLRIMVASSGVAHTIVSLTQSNLIQTISFLGSLVALLLLSIGFVLMSKDRADDLNRTLAIQDDLTGLANRRRMNEVLKNEWARSRRSEQPLTVALIDIDFFKAYNDHYGHQSGDACLRRIAQTLQASTKRAGDLAARYGGEEFLLIWPNTDAASGFDLAESVRKSVEALKLPHAHAPAGHVTISVGVASQENDCFADTVAMLQAADEALYTAKHAGRNQAHMASASLQRDVSAPRVPMKLVQLLWRKAYECGHPVIDAQHRQLFNHANALLSALLEGMPASDLDKLVAGFEAEIAQHFAQEEAILRQAGFADVAHHAQQHRELLDKASVLTENFRQRNLSVGAVFEFLAYEVVARHILSSDRAFFACLASQRNDALPDAGA